MDEEEIYFDDCDDLDYYVPTPLEDWEEAGWRFTLNRILSNRAGGKKPNAD